MGPETCLPPINVLHGLSIQPNSVVEGPGLLGELYQLPDEGSAMENHPRDKDQFTNQAEEFAFADGPTGLPGHQLGSDFLHPFFGYPEFHRFGVQYDP